MRHIDAALQLVHQLVAHEIGDVQRSILTLANVQEILHLTHSFRFLLDLGDE